MMFGHVGKCTVSADEEPPPLVVCRAPAPRQLVVRCCLCVPAVYPRREPPADGPRYGRNNPTKASEMPHSVV